MIAHTKLKSYLWMFPFFFLVILSCGEKLNEKEISTDDNFDSGTCGRNVVSRFKNVVNTCDYRTENECNKEVLSFLKKYPDVYCSFEDESHGMRKEIWISENEVQNLRRV